MTEQEQSEAFGGIDPDEIRTMTFRQFREDMMLQTACCLIKMWSIVQEETDVQSMRESARSLILTTVHDVGLARVLEEIRMADLATGQHTDLGWMVLPAATEKDTQQTGESNGVN